MKGICKLCCLESDLRISHVIPNFVYKWHKKNNGPMRLSSNPNLRVQDGYKKPMLCDNCERQFKLYEDSFKKILFDPLYETSQSHFPYDSNMLKFCVSLLWRVVAFLQSESQYIKIPEQIHTFTTNAFMTWRDFLLGNIGNPEQYRLYVIILDKVAATTSPKIPHFLSTYFLSTCDIDICYTHNNVYIYAKILKILVISVINIESAKCFQVENIHVKSGIISRLYNISLPSDFVNHLFNHCQMLINAQESTSDNQKKKIIDLINKNKDTLSSNTNFQSYVDDCKRYIETKEKK